MTADLSHEIEVVPAFHDLDPLGIVWHGHYVKYLELARSALMARFDYDYPQMRDSGFAWPIVDMHLKYVRPARYGQRLKVLARITEWENRLRVDYRISDALDGHCLTKAHTIQVAVALADGEMQYLCPAVLGQKLGVTPC
ncbi:acyl-CoA thioesterase [Chitinimonas arctica]|uniref:Acyl-CoA thioesterase n=1 Tax=Chitinimonas arctica TaxID=2594795 RepID=A0A516SI13_9NEIS|nr:acyl-CoA thioesterase [Chitinimonas arctica]QDQ27794.1 acyl-CoA thioesterase [Chitinimonas arctica]